MLYQNGPYYWDANNKYLFHNDLLFAKGKEAQEYALLLGDSSDWVRVRCRTPMKNRYFNGQSEPVNGMGHSSNRWFDRDGNSLREYGISRDEEYDDII